MGDDEKTADAARQEGAEDHTEDRGFTVNDRRGQESRHEEPPERNALPTIDFSTLVLSLSTSALVHLGEAPNPDTTRADEPAEKNLPLAKQTIDIVEMLQEKTQGNLTDDEAKLLRQLLYDLRLRYVAARK